jgi:hypothetical protein
MNSPLPFQAVLDVGFQGAYPKGQTAKKNPFGTSLFASPVWRFDPRRDSSRLGRRHRLR